MLKDKIKQERKNINWSQAKLGSYLGVTQQAVAKWENGIAEPDRESISKMCDLFNISSDYLLEISSVEENTVEKKEPGNIPPGLEKLYDKLNDAVKQNKIRLDTIDDKQIDLLIGILENFSKDNKQ